MVKRLLGAAILVSSLLISATSEHFNFYKLSLIWPPSACNVGTGCRSSIPKHFTTHGFWPLFANDTQVPPYEKDPTCTDIVPTSPDDILDALQPIEDYLKRSWPNLMSEDDSLAWKEEWRNHGMCSEYPDLPYDYFQAAYTRSSLATILLFDFPLADEEVVAGSRYTVNQILGHVKTFFGSYPQIACNMKDGTRQLLEIRICFTSASGPPRDCPNKFAGDCVSEDDEVILPDI